MVNFGDVRRGSWNLLISFNVCSDAKEREWDEESQGKQSHIFFPSKTATLVSEFAVEDLFIYLRFFFRARQHLRSLAPVMNDE